jgi:predicted DNA-binding transcriptional regulator YafY
LKLPALDSIKNKKMPQKPTSDLRLKRIFEIHKCLRDKPHDTEELLKFVKKIDPEINERTIKADIDLLRSLGAEIPKGNKHHGFRYSKPFSLLERIEGKKLSETDDLVAYIQQVVDKSPTLLGLDSVLLSLEQRIRTTDARKNPYLDFEKIESDGLKRLEEFYRYIKSKRVYEIEYTPFGRDVEMRTILPLLLKEYNHRWTLIAFDKDKNEMQNFPLERIGKVSKLEDSLKAEKGFDGENYFQDVIGVTIRKGVNLEIIKFKISKPRAYYVKTKRLHHSQTMIEETENDITFTIKVIPNNEMWAKFMELADDLELIEPIEMRHEMKEKLLKSIERYR